jgi:hypothetical protein
MCLYRHTHYTKIYKHTGKSCTRTKTNRQIHARVHHNSHKACIKKRSTQRHTYYTRSHACRLSAPKHTQTKSAHILCLLTAQDVPGRLDIHHVGLLMQATEPHTCLTNVVVHCKCVCLCVCVSQKACAARAVTHIHSIDMYIHAYMHIYIIHTHAQVVPCECACQEA